VTSRQLMAIFGWDSIRMAEQYTRRADQQLSLMTLCTCWRLGSDQVSARRRSGASTARRSLRFVLCSPELAGF
jgi:hypothetical protein